MKKLLLVLVSCSALAAAAAVELDEGGWYPPVRAAINAMLARHTGDGDAYVAFDFDNTCMIGDCGHAALAYAIDNLDFAFGPDDWETIFFPDIPDLDRPLEPGKTEATVRNAVKDCAELHRELLALKAKQPLSEVRKTEAFAAFAAKARYLRKRVPRTFGSTFGYPWNKRFYSRRTPADFRAFMHRALDSAVAEGRFRRCLWRVPATRPGRTGVVEVPMFRGFVVPPEMKDLLAKLKAAGIAVYVVSGSFHDKVTAAALGRYGLEFPEANIFGIHVKLDANGCFNGETDTSFPLPWADGKPEVIRRQIAPRHHGKAPVMVVGDANGDYPMLTAFGEMEVGLVFDTKVDPKCPLGLLNAAIVAGKADKRYHLQGRDETKSAFLPAAESVRFAEEVFAPAKPGVREVTPERLALLRHSLVHRGDGRGRPDNTMEAILHTWAKGYSPESDIRYTKDKVVVAFHDGSLKGRKLSEWLWKDLREEDVGSYRDAKWATCRVPTWETIFTAMRENPSRRMHIDWKDVEPEKVAEMVKAHGLEKQCWFIARDLTALKRYKAALPEGLTTRWVNVGDWSHFDFAAPGKLEACEAYERRLYEESAREGFAGVDNMQLHCHVRFDGAGDAAFCPKLETLKAWCDEIHAAGREASIYIESTDGENPRTYAILWQLGFDSFGSDYPESIYRAISAGFAL